MNPLIGVAIATALQLIEFITKSAEHARQSEENTPAEMADLDKKIADLKVKLKAQLGQ